MRCLVIQPIYGQGNLVVFEANPRTNHVHAFCLWNMLPTNRYSTEPSIVQVPNRLGRSTSGSALCSSPFDHGRWTVLLFGWTITCSVHIGSSCGDVHHLVPNHPFGSLLDGCCSSDSMKYTHQLFQPPSPRVWLKRISLISRIPCNRSRLDRQLTSKATSRTWRIRVLAYGQHN